jgi:alkane 1-monooxygenase
MSLPRAFVLHLWAFVLPLITVGYWLTGPHLGIAALLWVLPIVVLVTIDNTAPNDTRQPAEDLAGWPFDLQMFLLVAIQLANYGLLGVTASKLSIHSIHELVGLWPTVVSLILLPGVTAGYSGIVLAHELVHRRNPIAYFLGRLLLMGVLYEHFATEHVRGHHPRLGTYDDPATARFGETHRHFLLRTIPGQFRSAWHLETVRLGRKPNMLRHRVLQGVVAELGILIATAWLFGPVALAFFVIQALTAVVLLETVNYVEHWGIQRASKKVVNVDSWDTDNWFTLYTLVGLSRHSDHHAQASRPFHKLRYFAETAKMPAGYYGTVIMALVQNRRYMQLATEELQRKKLGPFRARTAQPEAQVVMLRSAAS